MSAVKEFTLPEELGFGPLPHIPDDLTLPQFILDSWHPNRLVNKNLNPVLIEDSTGRGVGHSEVRFSIASTRPGNCLTYDAFTHSSEHEPLVSRTK